MFSSDFKELLFAFNEAFVISSEDLITNKLAAARLQDLADVEAVQKAAESQRPGETRSP